jgi:hypothetical protein
MHGGWEGRDNPRPTVKASASHISNVSQTDAILRSYWLFLCEQYVLLINAILPATEEHGTQRPCTIPQLCSKISIIDERRQLVLTTCCCVDWRPSGTFSASPSLPTVTPSSEVGVQLFKLQSDAEFEFRTLIELFPQCQLFSTIQ